MKCNTLFALFIMLFCTACSDIPKTNYKDNSYLEAPPGYKVKKAATTTPTTTPTSTPKAKVQDPKGLGDLVALEEISGQDALIIDKKFDRAWIVVEKALGLNKIEITDRNRDAGLYHVDYDPDIISGYYPKFIQFLANDRYEESSYKVELVEKDTKIHVTANIKPPEIDSSLYEDEEDREEPKDGSSKLIKMLFKTIQDDLSGDF